MADTLQIFGTEYTNVAGIIATTPNETDLTYIRPQGTKSISANGTGIDVAAYASVDVSVPSGDTNNFVITLSYNSQSNTWTPDKTLAEIAAAYSTEKNIVTYAYNSADDMIQASGGSYEDGANKFWYWVDNSDSDASGDYTISSTYYLDSNGVTLDETIKSYRTTPADAIPADVANGKTFFNANGQQVGTASTTPTLQNKTVSPSESQQSVQADSGYDGLDTVTVNAISSTYVGSGITRRDSDDLTVSGATITAPAGYYSAAAQKSVASGSASAPSSISGTSASVTTGTNTLTLTKTVSVTPVVSAGYVSSGTATNSSVSLTASIPVNPTVTASGATVTIPTGYYTTQTTKSISSGSATAPSTISGTAATVNTGTNTLTLTKTVSVTPTVSAGYVSSGTAGNSSVSLTASITTKAAATYHPSTTAQSIAGSTYLTGAQTIAAVTTTNLSASNIVSGVTIKVGDSSDDDCVASVTGSVILQNYYTGSSAPASSLGQNGDIYIQQ